MKVQFETLTEEQLQWLCTRIDQMCTEAWDELNKFEDPNEAPDELVLRANALVNFCHDLEIPGYEWA